MNVFIALKDLISDFYSEFEIQNSFVCFPLISAGTLL